MRDFVLHSSQESQADEPIGVERFRPNTAALDKPAYFHAVFYLGDRRYRHGFEVDEYRVRSGGLYHARQRETRLHVREGQQFDLSSVLKEGGGWRSALARMRFCSLSLRSLMETLPWPSWVGSRQG
jgi:hypothetical protein